MRLRGVLLLVFIGIVTKGCDNVGERGKILPVSLDRYSGIPLVLRDYTGLGTPISTPTPIPTYTPTARHTNTSTPMPSSTPTRTHTSTLTRSATPTLTPTDTVIPSPIPTYTRIAPTPATMYWTYIKGRARITYYASSFHNGNITASGEPYDCCVMRAALGPELLAQTRRVTGQQWPWIRITDRSTGIRYAFKVNDTGSERLEVDLPYCTWLFLYGYAREQGIFYGLVEVGKNGVYHQR